jgi:adenylate cyclase
MMKIYLTLVLICVSCKFSYTQEMGTDSLEAVIAKLDDDSVKINSLIDLGIIQSGTDPKAALEIYSEAIEIANHLKYTPGLARAHHQAGNANYFYTDYIMALEEWKAAEFHYSVMGDLAGVANMLSNSGAIFYNQNEFDKALELYLKALNIAEQIADKKRIATIQQNIGALHSEKHTYDLSLDAYLNALDLFREINYSEGIGVASMNAGRVYSTTKLYDKAMEMNTDALLHLRLTPYFTGILRSIGETHIATGNFDQGILYLDSSYVIAANARDWNESSQTLTVLGSAYEGIGNTDLAIEFFEKAKTEAFQVDSSNSPLELATVGLVRLYAFKNNYSKAFENQRLMQNIRDSKYNMETDKKFNSLLFNFELDKKEVEIALLSRDQELQMKEVKRQKELRNGISGGFLIVCFFCGNCIYATQQDKGRKKAE